MIEQIRNRLMPLMLGLIALLLPMVILGDIGTVIISVVCLIWGMAVFVDVVGEWLFKKYEELLDR